MSIVCSSFYICYHPFPNSLLLLALLAKSPYVNETERLVTSAVTTMAMVTTTMMIILNRWKSSNSARNKYTPWVGLQSHCIMLSLIHLSIHVGIQSHWHAHTHIHYAFVIPPTVSVCACVCWWFSLSPSLFLLPWSSFVSLYVHSIKFYIVYTDIMQRISRRSKN